MIKKDVSQDILLVLISCVVVIFSWIGFDVYQAFNKKPLFQVDEKQLSTLNPDIDFPALDHLKQKLSPTQEDLSKIPDQRVSSFASPEKSASPGAGTKPKL